MSFLVDGFRAAKWLKENEPAAFHILSATPVRFQISVNGVSSRIVLAKITNPSKARISLGEILPNLANNRHRQRRRSN